MEIYHHISFNGLKSPKFLQTIKTFEIKYNSLKLPWEGGDLITFEITESDQKYKIIRDLVNLFGAVDMVDTFFTDDEIRNSDWLRMVHTYENGYPQPKMHWPIKQKTRKICCSKCAIYEQINPFRISREPNLKKNQFMSLIWTNEILCSPEVIQDLEFNQVKGYEPWEVLLHSTGEPSTKIKQLFIPNNARKGITVEDSLKRIVCPECGEIKYYPHVKGKMRLSRDALLENVDFMLSNEWFGQGYIAWREIFVSKRVANLILDRKWKGARFKVIEIV